MNLGPRLRPLVVWALALVLGACAAAPPPPQAVAPPPGPRPPTAVTPAPPPVVPEAPSPPPTPTPLERMVAARRDRAVELERAGQLRRALDEWKIALAIDPQDAQAQAGRRALEARVERSVGERLRQGREALDKGDHLEARRHFLAVLVLDPANAAAFQALQNEVKEIRFVPHTVRAGETLATIAERYYGDRSRSEVIWETNQLPPNPRLAAGTLLKIPEIPGVPFVLPELRPRPPAEATVRPDAPVTDPGRADGRAETVEINPLLVEAREALDRGEFQVALVDVDKLLASNAQNPDGVELKKAALYGLGRSQLNQRKYSESIQTLNQLVKLAPNYQDSPLLLRQARERAIQQHYSQGLQLFREEKLEEAIGQWRLVLEYDPQHVNAKRNLEQAERLLRNLQQRQQPKRTP